MNWNISAWCIRNPIPPIVLFILLSVAGIAAFLALGVESEPNVDLPSVSISVSQNGAAPQEIETQITRKIEDAVAGIANVKHVRSTVRTGSSETELSFELGTNADRATSDVREAMTRIRSQLPRGIDEPVVQRQDYVSDGSITYTVSSNKRSDMELCSLIENSISRSMMAMPSIGQANRFGGTYRQICVDLDPVRLEAFGLTADTVNSQLKALNVNLPGGRGDVGKVEESIRTLGSAHSVEDLRKTRISLPGKRWVELASLGNVYDGSSEQRHLFLVDGKPAIGLDLVRRRGKNVVQMEKDAELQAANLEKRYPDLKFTRIFNSAKYVKESCSATFEAMILGALLAVLVIFLFLRDWRAALISALAMPLSVIPTFAYMQASNFTLNDMSLLGLALVIGILVDDAIVEIENIVRHMQMGKTPYQASIDAADEIGLAVVATTMAAVVVFLPVGFMGGISGLFFRQFGLTVAVAVFCSLLVARLITPLMSAFWLKEDKKSHEHTERPSSGLNQSLSLLYDKILALALAHRFSTVLMAAICFGASVALFQALPTSLMSHIDRGSSWIKVELAPGSSLKETVGAIENISSKIMGRQEVERVFAVAGQGETSKGFINVTLKDREERKLSQDQFEESLRPELSRIPGAKAMFGGGWGSGNVQVMLTSYDADALEKTAQELSRQMRTIPELSDVQSSAQALRPEIEIEPDTARAAEQGVSVEAIARTALIATIGDTDANTAKFDLSDRQIPIVVRLAPEFRQKMSVIANMKVAGNDGKLIPLGTVANVRMDSGVFSIERYDRARQIHISAKFGSDYSLGQALKRIKELPAFKNKPASVSDHPAGDAEDQQDMFGGFGYAIFTGVLLIYAVLVLLFRGFLQPLTIMMSLPLSLGGALLGLWALAKPIDMYALIGIVMLMGLVTKNAILLVEYCLVQMDKGLSRNEAIFLAGRTRMRPILMTTTAMIAGMLPIAIGFGAGAEARAPMAIAVVGGLFMSTVLTLVVVPVVFSYMDELQRYINSFFKVREPQTHKKEADGARAAAGPS